MPSAVLISVTATAPASRTALATSTTRSVFGLSFAHIGKRATEHAATTSADNSASWANIPRRPSRFGHERFTSSATTCGGTATASIRAASAYSSTLRPHTLTTTRAPAATSAGRSSFNQSFTPGPCRPTALIIPAGVGCTRGDAFPAQGCALKDLTTIAPSSDVSKYEPSSLACPAVPEAVITGDESCTPPTSTPPSEDKDDSCWRIQRCERNRRPLIGRGTPAVSGPPLRCLFALPDHEPQQEQPPLWSRLTRDECLPPCELPDHQIENHHHAAC